MLSPRARMTPVWLLLSSGLHVMNRPKTQWYLIFYLYSRHVDLDMQISKHSLQFFPALAQKNASFTTNNNFALFSFRESQMTRESQKLISCRSDGTWANILADAFYSLTNIVLSHQLDHFVVLWYRQIHSDESMGFPSWRILLRSSWWISSLPQDSCERFFIVNVPLMVSWLPSFCS